MERTSAAWFSGNVDSMGEAVRDDPHLCLPRKRASSRRLDPSQARHSAGFSTCPATVHSCCRRLGGVHITTLPQRPSRRFSVPWHPWRHPPAAICRRYDLFHPGVLGGCARTLHHDGYLLRFLKPPTEPSKVVLHRLWAIPGGDGGLLSDFDDSNWRVTDPILGIVSGGSLTTNSGLAAGVGKGGDATGRMASTPLIAGWSPRPA